MPSPFKYQLGHKDIRPVTLLVKQVCAEFIGIFIINFFGGGACTQSENGTFVALAFGLAVFIAISTIGHISGGHVNPAVTAGMLVVGKISFIKSVFYVISQCLGAMCGSLALKALLPDEDSIGVGHTVLSEHNTALKATLLECLLGFILVFTVCGVCDENKSDRKYTAPLTIGLSVTLGHLGTLKYTGSSMNPARTFGTAVASGIWDHHWVYWVGPILGGLLASLLYHLLFSAKSSESHREEDAADEYKGELGRLRT